MNKAIDIAIKIGMIIILIIAAATKQQYSYYTFVRWAIFAASIYFAYSHYRRRQIGLVIYFSVVSILFNPLKPLWFQKETWHLIDYLVSAIIMVTIYFDLTQHKNKAA